MDKLIFGCGYLGSRVAKLWQDAGHRVCIVTRDPARAHALRNAGYWCVVADVLRRETLVDLPAARSVLYAVSHDRTNTLPASLTTVSGLQAVLSALPASVERFIYISSTGVYAQNDGGWVDENSPCDPQREGGRACLAAERLLASHPVGQRAIILRLAGIYGPERIPRRRELLAGEPIPAPTEGYLNLIHVDDAARVVVAADSAQQVPRTYLVSDGHPAERGDYFAEMARLLGAPPPKFETPRADAPVSQRATSSKRVSNARLLAEFGVKLQYPSYHEGLAAIVAAEAASPPAGMANRE